jgi:tetratricopeptide (TPR) repeat protein
MLALVAPLAAAFVLAEPDASRRRTGATVLAVLVTAILLTLSRGPWAGAAAALIFLTVWALRQRLVRGDRELTVVLIALVAIIAVRVAWSDSSSLLRTRFLSIWNVAEDPSFVNRFTYADAGWRMVGLHPIRGAGFDHFGLLYPRYREVEPPIVPIDQMPTKVHNGYLDRAVATGVPGVVLYLALVGYVALALWRRAQATDEPRDDRRRLLAIALLAAIGGFLIQDLSGWEELPLSVFFWVVLGFAVSVARPDAEAGWQPRRNQARIIATVALLIAIGIAVQAVRTWRHIRADRALVEAALLDVQRDWPVVASLLEAGVAAGGDLAHYLDAAGLVWFRRFVATHDAASYQKAAELFDRAADRDRLDPYLLVHRIDLETAALQTKMVTSPSAGATQAADLVAAIDRNNATMYTALARYHLAGGRPAEALAANSRAHELRPSQARNHLIDGDIYAAMRQAPEQLASYRAALGGADEALWPEVVRKYILALIRAGSIDDAIAHALTAIDRAPEDLVLHNLLGVAYLNKQEAELAAVSFRRALAIAPGNATAQQGLAEAEQLRESNRR